MNKILLALILLTLSMLGLYILFSSVVFVAKMLFYTAIIGLVIVGWIWFFRNIRKLFFSKNN